MALASSQRNQLAMVVLARVARWGGMDGMRVGSQTTETQWLQSGNAARSLQGERADVTDVGLLAAALNKGATAWLVSEVY